MIRIVRQVAAIGTDAACRTVGRRTVVRTARYVLSRARFGLPERLVYQWRVCATALDS